MRNTSRPYQDTQNHIPVFNENVGKIAAYLASSRWSDRNPRLFAQIREAVKKCDTDFIKSEEWMNVAPFAELQCELGSLMFLISRGYNFSNYSWNLGGIYTLACNEAAGGSQGVTWPHSPTELSVDLWPLVANARKSLKELWKEPPENALENVTFATFTWVRDAFLAGTDL